LFQQNESEIRLLDILLEKHNVLLIEEDDKNKGFLDKMCNEGFLANMGTYYHVNSKLKKRLLEILKNAN